MKYLLLFIAVLSFDTQAEFDPDEILATMTADIIETWDCSKSRSSDVLVKAKVIKGRKSGLIDVAGITHAAFFRISGFDREWFFDKNTFKGIFNFMFIIKPDGSAYYYDYTANDTAKPSFAMYCKLNKR